MKKIAEEMRRIVKLQRKYNAKRMQRQISLQKECKHPNVVIVHSAYEGSYINDWTDSHSEARICLVCGTSERHAKRDEFQVLVHPFRRMEISQNSDAFSYSYVMEHSLSELIEHVKKTGYTIIR